jgi:hypothetical protein
MLIHIKNNMRGKHPTEKGFMAMPLDWRKHWGEQASGQLASLATVV